MGEAPRALLLGLQLPYGGPVGHPQTLPSGTPGGRVGAGQMLTPRPARMGPHSCNLKFPLLLHAPRDLASHPGSGGDVAKSRAQEEVNPARPPLGGTNKGQGGGNRGRGDGGVTGCPATVLIYTTLRAVYYLSRGTLRFRKPPKPSLPPVFPSSARHLGGAARHQPGAFEPGGLPDAGGGGDPAGGRAGGDPDGDGAADGDGADGRADGGGSRAGLGAGAGGAVA
eukprot:scaffold107884_cov29-Tisochrysis_lutea.AAC.1